MTKDEALRMALEALEGFIPYLPLKDEAQCNSYDKAITALRLAIDAQSMASKSTYKEQLETKDEPFEYWNAVEGWVKLDEVREHFESVSCGTIYKNEGEGRVPLYASPQPRKPLPPNSPCEMTQAEGKMFKLGWLECEAAHGIKE